MLLIGGVTRNAAMLAALREKLPGTEFVVLPESPWFEAWGSALLTRDEPLYKSPFSAEKLPVQVLGNLLWAAFGINRPDTGHRTAPSAVNWQEIDIYVATADGLYLYEAKGHTLQPVLAKDIRAETGMQPFVKDAPVELIYVADYSRMGKGADEGKNLNAAEDTGFISENAYLFCASEGLATVVRGSVDKTALATVMKLRPDQKIILAQTVGYPKK